MSRGPQPFKQSDVKRALKAVLDAGAKANIEIRKDGTIVIVPTKGDAPTLAGGSEEIVM
jgi:hypothetical protein